LALFAKDLLHLAPLQAADESLDGEPLRVTDDHVHAALDVLLDDRNLLTRRLVGGTPGPDA
jgi:hypothetical protein